MQTVRQLLVTKQVEVFAVAADAADAADAAVIEAIRLMAERPLARSW